MYKYILERVQLRYFSQNWLWMSWTFQSNFSGYVYQTHPQGVVLMLIFDNGVFLLGLQKWIAWSCASCLWFCSSRCHPADHIELSSLQNLSNHVVSTSNVSPFQSLNCVGELLRRYCRWLYIMSTINLWVSDLTIAFYYNSISLRRSVQNIFQ